VTVASADMLGIYVFHANLAMAPAEDHLRVRTLAADAWQVGWEDSRTIWPPARARAEAVSFVSPQGNDAWSGCVAAPADNGSDGPLATLHKAVERSRRQAVGPLRRIVLQFKSIDVSGAGCASGSYPARP
jgi:hypothetical protein